MEGKIRLTNPVQSYLSTHHLLNSKISKMTRINIRPATKAEAVSMIWWQFLAVRV